MRGSGNMARESRNVGGFTSVAFGTSGDATISPGAQDSLVIEAEDNLLPLISTEVHEGTLRIRNNSRDNITPTRPIKYTITVRDLRGVSLGGAGNIQASGLPGVESINLGGAGNIAVDGIQNNAVHANIGGSGAITLSGNTRHISVNVGGSGSLDSSELEANDADVVIAGSGSVAVSASEELSCVIAGSGSVRYLGSPKLSKVITGSGHVRGY